MLILHLNVLSRAVPVLRGRTAVSVFTAFMQSFKEEFGGWFGNTITECLIGKLQTHCMQGPVACVCVCSLSAYLIVAPCC